jgi:hypothetical protein
MKIIDINGQERECLTIDSDPTYPGFIKVVYASRREPGTTRIEWYPMMDFIKQNPSLKDSIKNTTPPAKDDLGVVTKSGKDHLKDSTKKWQTNCYAGFSVWISRGKGEGQIRTVLKNTFNALFINKPWDTKPDKTSQYVVSLNIKNPSPLANTLPGVKP